MNYRYIFTRHKPVTFYPGYYKISGNAPEAQLNASPKLNEAMQGIVRQLGQRIQDYCRKVGDLGKLCSYLQGAAEMEARPPSSKFWGPDGKHMEHVREILPYLSKSRPIPGDHEGLCEAIMNACFSDVPGLSGDQRMGHKRSIKIRARKAIKTLYRNAEYVKSMVNGSSATPMVKAYIREGFEGDEPSLSSQDDQDLLARCMMISECTTISNSDDDINMKITCLAVDHTHYKVVACTRHSRS